ncbi:MAG: 3-hydroxyacyl-CoA dehydrogenase family protein, partial [Deltaproteobacteria bacterium]|nr:3-hydroxyacyl-CoA dehydrogenase family protein [Deltaproteobacteria bacterium]
NDVKRAVVVGAGVMGHSIAHVFAQAGIEVNLVDLDEAALEHAMNLIKADLETLAEFKKIPGDDIPGILARIHPSTDLAGGADGVGFAIETVLEVPDVKRKVFSQLGQFCPGDTVIASNTSSLDIFSIAQITRPERLVVAHWFAPPHIIPLVEVVPGPETLPEVVTFTANLMERLGKKTVIMKGFVPSFIVNRIQHSISQAVWEMLEKGWATPEEIDLAIKMSLGIRLPIVGVAQTNDFTGLDLIYEIMKGGGRVSPLVEEKVKQGDLGVKTSKGVYDYGGLSEVEILKKRDRRYLKLLDHLERIDAFEPV